MNQTLQKRPLADLEADAREAETPSLVSKLPLSPGGVDPLGLRLINFDLMDRLIPGLNNVATRLRPYVAVTWAWWRAGELARESGASEILPSTLRAFVDRVEVAFAGSHLRVREFDGLLGSDVLERFRAGTDAYVFRGERWRDFQTSRRNNTSLMAPVAYGPSLKVGTGLGFLVQVEDGAFRPTPSAMPAVMAFNASLGPFLSHPLFASFDEAEVALVDLDGLHPHWRTESVSAAEREVGRERFLSGHTLLGGRRRISELILALLDVHAGDLTVDDIRLRLAEVATLPEGVEMDTYPPAVWRAIQTRQLFRLALEVLLFWVLRSLKGRPKTLAELTGELLAEASLVGEDRFGSWWATCAAEDSNPVRRLNDIVGQRRGTELAAAALTGLRDAIAAAAASGSAVLNGGPRDRLPLATAIARSRELIELSSREALETILSEWVIGLHAYWAIGRNGDDTQRLRLMLEEGGWSALVREPSFPRPTPDRLSAALSLMADCGIVARTGVGDEARYSAVP